MAPKVALGGSLQWGGEALPAPEKRTTASPLPSTTFLWSLSHNVALPTVTRCHIGGRQVHRQTQAWKCCGWKGERQHFQFFNLGSNLPLLLPNVLLQDLPRSRDLSYKPLAQLSGQG